MSRTIKTYLAVDTDTKKGVWTGAVLVYATICDIYVSGFGSASPEDLVLALHHKGTQVASCNTFVDNGDGFYKGSLDLDTVSLQALMETVVEPAQMRFVATLDDTENDSNLLDDYVDILANPYTGRQDVPVLASGVGVSGSVGHITSGTAIALLDVIRVHSDWYAYPQNSSDANLSGYTLGIALNVATGAGQVVNFITSGILTNTSWNWSRGEIYFTSTGVLTQTIPTSGFVQSVGFAFGAQSIIVRIGTPVGI